MSSSSFIWAVTSAVLALYIVFIKINLKKKKIKIKNGDYQMVVVVNKDLKMTNGKVLSQFGHAIDAMHEILFEYPDLVKAWRNCGSAKIALKGTQDDLNQVYYDAKEIGLLYYRVFDAGKTQIKAGSNTIIVVGPATKKELEPVTGRLSLY